MRGTLAVCLTLALLVLAPGAAAAAPSAAGGAQAASTTTAVGQAAPTDAADRTAPTDAADRETDGGDAADDACAAVAGGEQRPNPDEDVLGWENGCWHNDTIAITVDDGLNESELDAVVARTMARVEYVRELEFKKTVPVEVISREQFKENSEGAFDNVSKESRIHQNVKYEALFFVPEDEDALAQILANRGGSVLGYYSPTEDRIVIISDSDGPLQVSGPTLAHELAHALQDQHFDLTRYNRTTTEQDNAVNGLLEGDPTYTEYLYKQRCGDQWECPSRDTGGGTRPGPEFDWGIYFMGFQPYSDGGSFVQELRQQGGWEAVNEAYENPPASSEQVMYPEKYPEEKPATVTVKDTSNDEWYVPDIEGGVNYAEYGEAGMAAMFISPTYDDRNPAFVTVDELLTGRDLDSIDYSLSITEGWDGDRLYPYVTDDSYETNETGYVWKSVWDTPEDAREFAEAYVRMLEYRGAEPVTARKNTYRIPDSEPYGDAFYVNHSGDTVTIVNAPSVAELREIRAGAAPEGTATPTATATETATATATETADPGTPAGDDTTATPTATDTPGFGPVVALVAALAAALLARRR